MHDQETTAARRILEANERALLAALVGKLGEIGAASQLGVARGTLARAAAGFALTTGNAYLIRMRLHELQGGA